MSRSGAALLAILILTALVGWYAAGQKPQLLFVPEPPREIVQPRPQAARAPAANATKPAAGRTVAGRPVAGPRGTLAPVAAAARRAARPPRPPAPPVP